MKPLTEYSDGELEAAYQEQVAIRQSTPSAFGYERAMQRSIVLRNEIERRIKEEMKASGEI